MDTAIVASVIGAVATVGAVILAWILQRNKKGPDAKPLQKSKDATTGLDKIHRDDYPSRKMAEEEKISFIEAYITIIKPTTTLSDRYSDIISAQYDRLTTEVKELEKKQDWLTLLSVKQRLREYFEYSGKYLEGVEFGRTYLKALEKLQRPEEAIWTRVKHIGYLLALAEKHDLARQELRETLNQLTKMPKTDSICECNFYCCRYLGVSYQRDTITGDLNTAKEYFKKAKEYVDFFRHDKPKQQELRARLLGNFGNVALAERKYPEALSNYRESHRLFIEINDTEHIGIAKLQIAQALITSEEGIEEAFQLLEAAHLICIEIGWLEGEARVEEQFARLYDYKARKSRSARLQNIEQSLNAARRSEALFKRIGLQRAVGRIEELKTRIGHIG